MAPESDDLTQLLEAWCSGDENALEQLTQRVYKELHRGASAHGARTTGSSIANNGANQRGIHPAHWWQKCPLAESKKGIEEYLILLSIAETCAYRGVDFLRSGERDVARFAGNVAKRRVGSRCDG
jgi:hypothetical protein